MGTWGGLSSVASTTQKAPVVGSKTAIEGVVTRLTQPKKTNVFGPRNEGEAIVMQALKEQKERTKGRKMADIVHRLATPRATRPLSPNPGQRIMMLHSTPRRAVDKDRLSFLATASRRGGSCGAWGVHAGRGLPGGRSSQEWLQSPVQPNSARDVPPRPPP